MSLEDFVLSEMVDTGQIEQSHLCSTWSNQIVETESEWNSGCQGLGGREDEELLFNVLN